MKKEETNKLIAEFMKWKKVNAGLVGYETPHSVALIQPSEMLFRKSWDWLMPVVQKIGDDYYNTPFDETYSKLTEQYENIWTREDTYHAVVEFIKFYNQNK